MTPPTLLRAKGRRPLLILLLALITLLIILGLPDLAAAQNGLCPENSILLLPTPLGTWPAWVAVCNGGGVPLDNQVIIEQDAYLPCTQYVSMGHNPFLEDPAVVYVPPDEWTVGPYARVQFEVWFDEPYTMAAPSGYNFWIVYFNQYGTITISENHTLDEYQSVIGIYEPEPGIGDYFRVWLVDEVLTINEVEGGYFMVQSRFDTLFATGFTNIASWRASRSDITQPLLCNVPWATMPPTPTPWWLPTATATGTPEPTNTPVPTAPGNTVTPVPTWTRTPSPTPTGTAAPTDTPQPTATAVPTDTPVPTYTPAVWSTIASPATATKWPDLALPLVPYATPQLPVAATIAPLQATPWPTPYFQTPELPEIEPINTPGPVETIEGSIDVGLMATAISLVMTRYYTSTELALDLDETLPDWTTYSTPPPPIGTRTVTDPAIYGGLGPIQEAPVVPGTVTEALSMIPTGLAVVIGMVRMGPDLLPNFWSSILIIILYGLVAAFTLMLKYGLRIALALINWIIRLIELIPGF